MPFATSPDGTRLYFECHGAGTPLLLLAGQASDHREWDGVRADFAAHHRVIVLDYRGTGQSDKPGAPAYSTRGFAQDAVAVLDQLGLDRAHAYGISMGGRVAQWLAIEHPQRLGALVLGATTPGNAHGVARNPAITRAMQRGDWASLRHTLVSPAWMAAHPDFEARMAAMDATPAPGFARRLHYQASEGHDSWLALDRVTAPTLVLHGSDDEINVSANGVLLAERIPGAELQLIDGARHSYFEEYRTVASQRVLDFLRRHPLRV
jgi:pimeloyl-ACP methyl ester carboxylesterase